MRSWSIGFSERERVEMQSRSMPETDHYDWTIVHTRVIAGGFTAEVDMTILAGELASFRDRLVSLIRGDTTTAEFTTIEEQLWLVLEVDHLGAVRLNGKIWEMGGGRNCLAFEINIDQSFLPRTLSELNLVLQELSG